MKKVFEKFKIGFDRIKKSRVLKTLLLTLLAFNMFAVTSFAWLTINRKLDVDEMGMALAVDDTNAVYEAYMYDLETGKGTNLHKEIVVDENGTSTVKTEPLTITNIDLNQYDTIFRSQNKNTPVFAKIKITRNKSMPESGTVYITIDRDIQNTAQKDKEEQGLLTDYTSSIVRFTGFIIHDQADLTKTTPETLYEFINSSIIDVENNKTRFDVVEAYQGNEEPHSQTFISAETVEDETNTETHVHRKANSVTLAVEYSASDWYKVGIDSVMNVYLYITYDPTLIDCYMDDHGGGAISLDNNFIDFANDMTKVTISYEKATN
jgi:hypothetical protein